MTQPNLMLENAQGLMRKISINVLNKDAEQTLFTLPIEGVPLSREQLNLYMGERTFESWFYQRPDGVWMPMPWLNKLERGEVRLADEFECEGAAIVVSGGKELVFQAEETDEDDDDDEDAAPPVRVTDLVLTPKPGAVTLFAFHLQVRPGLGKENLALQEHQYRHVTLTLGDTKLVERKGRQQSLPLTDGSAEPREVSGGFKATKSGAEVDAALHAHHPELAGETMGAEASVVNDAAEFQAGAEQQVAAFNAKPGEVIDGTTPKSRRRRKENGDVHR